MTEKIENIRKMIEDTEKEWRELGFYYDYDKESSSWIIAGSQSGVYKFSNLIEEYSNNPKNDVLYEHDHYGPYMFLKIITLNTPEINDKSIGGTLKDLSRLSKIIKSKIDSAKVGDEIIIDKEYCDSNSAVIKLEIKDDNFDIISLDEWLSEKRKEINC